MREFTLQTRLLKQAAEVLIRFLFPLLGAGAPESAWCATCNMQQPLHERQHIIRAESLRASAISEA